MRVHRPGFFRFLAGLQKRTQRLVDSRDSEAFRSGVYALIAECFPGGKKRKPAPIGNASELESSWRNRAEEIVLGGCFNNIESRREPSGDPDAPTGGQRMTSRSFFAGLAILLFCACSTAPTFAADLPTPESVIGFRPGTDCRLADWEAIGRYFRALDDASDRVRVETIGRSTMGKEMLLAVISSEENIRSLERIREAWKALADPRSLEEEDAARLAAETPVAVFVGCAQHATEIASTQAAMEIAHRVAADASPGMERIRDRVVFLLVPSLNPDGHQMVCDWYAEHVGTPFEGCRMPWLYHKYVGHDTNRDWAMITQAETRHVSRVLYEEWFPQILIDVHQMGNRGARMFLPPYYDPINPNIDPLHQYQLALLSARMQLDLSTAGHKGIITNALFDEWLLGYFTSVPSRHNIVTQLIEMASVHVASPVFQRRTDLRVTRRGGSYSARSNFPEPWEGGWWRLRDIVEYEETALLSVLGHAARNGPDILRNFRRLAEKQVDAGRKEPPFAFLLPAGQDDPATAGELAAALMRGGIEVHRALGDFVADEIPYAAGTDVVLMAQPCRAHAKDLLEIQAYPDLRSYPGGPPERPYDIAGWTYPLLMGVRAVEVVNPFEADLKRLAPADTVPAAAIAGSARTARHLLVPRSQNNAFTLVHRVHAAGGTVAALAAETVIDGESLPPGTFVFDGTGTAGVRELGLRAVACAALPGDTPLLDVTPVRLGLYQPWTTSMDEGWTRWVLERFEFPYRSLHDAEIRAGGLRDRYDAIVLPDVRASSIVDGVREGSLPKKYTGGIGDEGVFALRDFVRRGGTLIALDSSCELLIDKLELPLRNVVAAGKEDKRFFCPGSILMIDADPAHPLAFGLPEAVAIMHSSSPVFGIVPRKKETAGKEGSAGPGCGPPSATIVGSYPKTSPLLSGWVENDGIIQGKAALVQASFGAGTAVLIGFRCQFRAQSWGTFKVLFNAVLGAGQSAPPAAAPPESDATRREEGK